MKKIVLITGLSQHSVYCNCKTLINMLHDNGYTVHVAANDSFEYDSRLIAMVDKFIPFPFNNELSFIKNLYAQKSLRQIIKNEKYCVIHSFTPNVGIITRNSAKDVRKSGITVIHTADAYSFGDISSPHYAFEKHTAECTDKIITITQNDFKRAKEEFDTNIYYNHGFGIDSNEFYLMSEDKKAKIRQNLGITSNTKVVFSISKHNQKATILAMAKIVQDYSDSKLILYANAQPNNFDHLIEDNNLFDKVSLIKDNDSIADYMNIADCCINCDNEDTLHLDVIKAMLCGCGVIVHNNDANKEIVRENETGFLVDTNNISILSDAIVRMFIVKDYLTESAIESASLFCDKNVYNELKFAYFDK